MVTFTIARDGKPVTLRLPFTRLSQTGVKVVGEIKSWNLTSQTNELTMVRILLEATEVEFIPDHDKTHIVKLPGSNGAHVVLGGVVKVEINNEQVTTLVTVDMHFGSLHYSYEDAAASIMKDRLGVEG